MLHPKGWGGWCPQFNLMWCITKVELLPLGFVMAVHSKPSPDDSPNIPHVNVLKFIALLANVWFALATCHACDPQHQQQHIGNFLTNNTSALSWMLHAGKAKQPHSCQLAHFLQVLLTFSPVHFQFHSHCTQASQMRQQTCCHILHVQSHGDPLSELDPMICSLASLTKCSISCCQYCLGA